MTAQDVFKELLQSTVAPALGAHGLKGSGQVFELPDERFWALLGFQKSTYSDRSKVKFTINLCVVSKAEYGEARRESSYLPAKPSPNIQGGPGWWQRIGYLLPERRDYWWTIGERDPIHQVAEQVLQAITEFGLPALRAQMGS